MSWERRQRGGRYYTRSKRVNGKISREYIGTGLHARLAANEDAQRQAERRQARIELQELSAATSVVDELVDGASSTAHALASGALLAAGYHRHDRGEWRKRRG